MTLQTHSQSKRPRRFRNPYGVPTVQMAIYPPSELRERIEREVVLRTVRDGAGAWNESRVIVDLLYTALGVTPPQRASEPSND